MNLELMMRLSSYLNDNPRYIDSSMVEEFVNMGFTREESVRVLLATILNLYDNKEIMDNYFKYMIKELDVKKYRDNAYYKNIKLDNISLNNWSIKKITYAPYELFVYNDLQEIKKGIVIPQIGFFTETFSYPCIYQNNREWMLITPNEIETMQKAIDEAHGHVLTYGLGLGYYQYMISLKENVESITIIECDREVISLFKKYILPQFENKHKITIINMDAYEYANKKVIYDYVFVDIWHDPTDGVEAYKKFKTLELPNIQYAYWIEDTLKYYL